MSSALIRRLVSRPLSSRTLLYPNRNNYSTPSGPATTTSTSPSHSRRRLLTLTLTAFASLTAYTVGSVYPPPPLSLLFPSPAPAPPDPTSPDSLEYTVSLEKQLLSLPLLQSLRAAPDAKEWYEARPYKNFPEERRVNNLTAGALRGPGKLAVPPVVWVRRDESESFVFIHVGRGLCGHDGIVHGGLLATLLDETMARTAINNLPERIGVTATLNLNYRAPTKADQFIVIKTKLGEVKGRKANVVARVEDMKGTLLVEAEAMFVQPKYAKLLNTAVMRQVMGEPPKDDHEPVLLADGQDMKALRREK
ncbi:mitochondrial protein [Lentinula guzmanii]|uniref:Mitochondrial protein n=2 Tax=Lentinula TaxID=5352 RepID=A0AA38JFQ4_9AGAR|nr:mitochondrial protein [Lentinula guzmanii]KAJ3786921.1 mitochondrial protein [Lentinula aff. detonsa]KAJ3799515.1 mitochondrial protein [Lentinula aff. detonsa]